MELFKRFFKKKNGKNERLPNFNEEITSELKPREGYVFHSDMFTVDSGYGRILSFFIVMVLMITIYPFGA